MSTDDSNIKPSHETMVNALLARYAEEGADRYALLRTRHKLEQYPGLARGLHAQQVAEEAGRDAGLGQKR